MIERRFHCTQIRAKGADSMTIVGHAAVFDQLSDDLFGFRERIAKGAFAESIEKDDIRSLWNHDANFVLGRNIAGNLRLAEDDIGLAIENDLPDTQMARDLMVSIRRGDISQMSFGFITAPGGDSWRYENGEPIRTLEKVQLFDVSPVTYPAYPQTDVSARNFYAARMKELRAAAAPIPDYALQYRKLQLANRIARGGQHA